MKKFTDRQKFLLIKLHRFLTDLEESGVLEFIKPSNKMWFHRYNDDITNWRKDEPWKLLIQTDYYVVRFQPGVSDNEFIKKCVLDGNT